MAPGWQQTGEQAKQLEQMKQNVELAIRPILVVIGVEHNRNKTDKVEVRDHLINGMRIHFLTGSKIWPNWFRAINHVGQAAFAVANRPDRSLSWPTTNPRSPRVRPRHACKRV